MSNRTPDTTTSITPSTLAAPRLGPADETRVPERESCPPARDSPPRDSVPCRAVPCRAAPRQPRAPHPPRQQHPAVAEQHVRRPHPAAAPARPGRDPRPLPTLERRVDRQRQLVTPRRPPRAPRGTTAALAVDPCSPRSSERERRAPTSTESSPHGTTSATGASARPDGDDAPDAEVSTTGRTGASVNTREDASTDAEFVTIANTGWSGIPCARRHATWRRAAPSGRTPRPARSPRRRAPRRRSGGAGRTPRRSSSPPSEAVRPEAEADPSSVATKLTRSHGPSGTEAV